MRDFLKRKFLSILNLFFCLSFGKKVQEKETNNTETTPASRLLLLFPFGRTTAV